MRFIDFEEAGEIFKGKSVAIVGSAPSVLKNEAGFIDSHDIVVRVNNFKLTPQTGYRTDVFYSFFGTSIRRIEQHLGETYLCMCKCPNDKGGYWGNKVFDFTSIYERRKDWWFCDTFIPSTEHFMEYFNLLDGRIPTTGFNAILDISKFDCEIYLTGFDFFESGIHRVNERWRPGRKDDPVGHVPHKEKDWILFNKDRFTFDGRLNDLHLQRQEVS